MKIKRKGKLPDATFAGRCGHCGCEVECEKAEVTYHGEDPREPGYHSVRCPTAGCGREIYVKAPGKH